MIKFPKTPRLVEVIQQDIHRAWKRLSAFVEEKVDGANVGVSFDGTTLQLQSRGQILEGKGDPQFDTFPVWAGTRERDLWKGLGGSLVLFGEWCYAKNKSFYDALPDLFIGYDVFDRARGLYLPASERDTILEVCGVHPVPRLWSGSFGKAPAFASLIGPSRFKTSKWRSVLAREAARVGVQNPLEETDDSDLMEGVYIRIEDADRVVSRAKLHREDYRKVRNDSWSNGPIITNTLR